MSKRPSFEAFKKAAMKDEKFKAEYDVLQEEFELIRKFILEPKKRR